MDNSKIITRINNLEAVAEMLLDECRKTKELLGRVSSPAARKGSSKFTDEDAARFRANHRNRMFGKQNV